MLAELQSALESCAVRANVDVSIAKQWHYGEEKFDSECSNLFRMVCGKMGIDCMDLLSIAGHDAYHLTRVAPTALMFTPCKSGISHNENEQIDLETTVRGVNVFMNAVVQRAERSVDRPS